MVVSAQPMEEAQRAFLASVDRVNDETDEDDVGEGDYERIYSK